uniref:Uncharacterized protein n=1 Tax=Rhizophora mucronata TaxID=61149 RepID=A0A2P2NQT6_RHIMU
MVIVSFSVKSKTWKGNQPIHFSQGSIEGQVVEQIFYVY